MPSSNDLGDTKLLLGVAITRDRSKHTLSLSQKYYAQDLLERFHMADSRPVVTPMDPGAKLSQKQCPTTVEEKEAMSSIPYINTVEALMYLAVATRPDIAHTVSVLKSQERWIWDKGLMKSWGKYRGFIYLEGRQVQMSVAIHMTQTIGLGGHMLWSTPGWHSSRPEAVYDIIPSQPQSSLHYSTHVMCHMPWGT